jgi:hypothetical protein
MSPIPTAASIVRDHPEWAYLLDPQGKPAPSPGATAAKEARQPNERTGTAPEPAPEPAAPAPLPQRIPQRIPEAEPKEEA